MPQAQPWRHKGRAPGPWGGGGGVGKPTYGHRGAADRRTGSRGAWGAEQETAPGRLAPPLACCLLSVGTAGHTGASRAMLPGPCCHHQVPLPGLHSLSRGNALVRLSTRPRSLLMAGAGGGDGDGGRGAGAASGAPAGAATAAGAAAAAGCATGAGGSASAAGGSAAAGTVRSAAVVECCCAGGAAGTASLAAGAASTSTRPAAAVGPPSLPLLPSPPSCGRTGAGSHSAGPTSSAASWRSFPARWIATCCSATRAPIAVSRCLAPCRPPSTSSTAACAPPAASRCFCCSAAAWLSSCASRCRCSAAGSGPPSRGVLATLPQPEPGAAAPSAWALTPASPSGGGGGAPRTEAEPRPAATSSAATPATPLTAAAALDRAAARGDRAVSEAEPEGEDVEALEASVGEAPGPCLASSSCCRPVPPRAAAPTGVNSCRSAARGLRGVPG